MDKVSFIIDNTELFTEKILVEFEIPLLFICKDKSNKRYTALCVDSDEEKYIVVESRIRDIVQMIQNTITMKELFLKAKHGMAWMITAGETVLEDIINIIPISEVDDEDLPVSGSFYEVYNADIHDYVDLLLNRSERPKEINYSVGLKTQVDVTLLCNLIEEVRSLKRMVNNQNEQSFIKTVYIA